MPIKNEVVAILCSDLHLSHTPPLARASEKCWYSAQKRVLDQLRQFKQPILMAGDIFDRANSGPELINFAIRNMPYVFAVAGQHDLPMHSLEDIRKSAYWTLVQAGKLTHVVSKFPILYADVYGFSWGQEVQPPKDDGKQVLKIAMHHAYRWYGTSKYKDAPSEQFVKISEYKGYDVAVIGDNHIPWDTGHTKPLIFNCGSLQRTKSDQLHHRPRVGKLLLDGTIINHELDISKDVFTAVAKEEEVEIEGIQKFLQEIQKLQGQSLDFSESLKRFMDIAKTSPQVRRYINEALETKGTL